MVSNIRKDEFRFFLVNQKVFKLLPNVFHCDHNIDAIIAQNTWTHVAGTYDARTGMSKVFIDGQLNGESQGSGLLSQDWENHAGIGQHKDSRFLNGKVDEFRIYNYAMNKDDVRKLMTTCNYNKGIQNQLCCFPFVRKCYLIKEELASVL